MRNSIIMKLKKRRNVSERKSVPQMVNKTKLYRQAADELKNGGNRSEAVIRVYGYEENCLSHRMVLSAKEKIHARLKADLILSLLLLEDGYEDAAVDNIWKTIKGTHRGLQIVANERLNCKIW